MLPLILLGDDGSDVARSSRAPLDKKPQEAPDAEVEKENHDNGNGRHPLNVGPNLAIAMSSAGLVARLKEPPRGLRTHVARYP